MYRKAALSQYTNIDAETRTQVQDSHQLVTLLFEKGCSLLRQSQENLKHVAIRKGLQPPATITRKFKARRC